MTGTLPSGTINASDVINVTGHGYSTMGVDWINSIYRKFYGFTTPNTYRWVVPPGVTWLNYTLYGGGGGAGESIWYNGRGGNYGDFGSVGSSGGNGAISSGTIGVTPGDNLILVVASGGRGGQHHNGENGGAGGTSIISNGGGGWLASAGGGGGGSAGGGGGAAPYQSYGMGGQDVSGTYYYAQAGGAGVVAFSVGINVYNYGDYRGMAYYARNIDGNCTQNCPSNCDSYTGSPVPSGVNCIVVGNVNCTNCDALETLQTNCNCYGAYNCTYRNYLVDCDCNCVDCNCSL